MADQMKLDMVLLVARSGRAELVDHRKKAARKKNRHDLINSWPDKPGQIFEVILSDPALVSPEPLGSVTAEFIGAEMGQGGEKVGRLKTRPDLMPSLSESMRSWLPKTLTGIRLSSLRRRREE